MKVSLRWLKEFLNLTQSPEEIADALTLSGLEAEGIEKKDDDHILEIGLTPNLGHCMSIRGIARELSATLKIPLKEKPVELDVEKCKETIAVKIDDPDLCHRYCCRLVKNISVGPSADWIVQRLENAGIRSVNNIVDIGNLVMLELGQPLHMFDFDEIEGGQINVREAKGDGGMQTLDEVARKIPDEALLICDEKKPLAFAGVMGEFSSAVSEKTKNVLIEAAHFTPQAVRKTSKLLNLRTDSSLRFERGIDPLTIASALDAAASLLSGKASQLFEATGKEYKPPILELNPSRCNQLLGTDLTFGEMASLLKRLEIEILDESKEFIRVSPPSYRNDLHAEIDLIEEVGRMYGFNKIPRTLPKHNSSMLTHAPLFLFEEEIREKFLEQGLQECLTCDLISPKLAELTAEKAMNTDAQIHVLYPASVDQSVLRPSLLPGLLEMVKFNLSRQNNNIAAFEVGHIHFKNNDKYLGEPAAAVILTGKERPYHFEQKPNNADFFDLKGHVENLIEALGLTAIYHPSHLQNFHPGRQARIEIDGITAGVLGQVHPKHLRTLGIAQRVYYAELNLHDLIDLKKTHHKAKEFALFPGSDRDWTITMDEKTPIGEILEEVKAFSSPLLEEVFLLDLYKSDKIGKDRKNATFRFQYRDRAKTIAFEEVEQEHKKLTQHIAKKLANNVP